MTEWRCAFFVSPDILVFTCVNEQLFFYIILVALEINSCPKYLVSFINKTEKSVFDRFTLRKRVMNQIIVCTTEEIGQTERRVIDS